MKIGLMHGDIVPPSELQSLGFDAVQVFFGHGSEGDEDDPSPDAVDTILTDSKTALAAMTLHVDLVGPRGVVQPDVDRLVRCVKKTADLDGRFGDNDSPILIWHPSAYPESAEVDDHAVFDGLCTALQEACETAEQAGVVVAIEITRAGSVGSAETFLRIKDRVPSSSLKVCMDAANFVPDRTPLDRAVRMLGPDIAIAHGKDSSFNEDGSVASYGPTGSGSLDYPAYLKYLREYADSPYFILEYYKTRKDLLNARDIVLAGLGK